MVLVKTSSGRISLLVLFIPQYMVLHSDMQPQIPCLGNVVAPPVPVFVFLGGYDQSPPSS